LSDSNAIADFLGKHLEEKQEKELYDFIYIATPVSDAQKIARKIKEGLIINSF